MASKIFDISLHSANLASIVLAIFSVIYCWRRYNPSYLRSFPIYTLVNLFVNSLNWFVRTLILPAEHVFTLFEFYYFCYFLRAMLARRRSRAVLGYFAVGYAGLYLFVIIRGDVLNATGFLVVVESFLLCFGCLPYFRELMLDPVDVDLSKNPAFWMVMGTLFYFVSSVLAVILSSWYYYKGERDYGSATYSINNYAQVISTVLYIKGMTCRRRRSS